MQAVVLNANSKHILDYSRSIHLGNSEQSSSDSRRGIRIPSSSSPRYDQGTQFELGHCKLILLNFELRL